MTSYTPSELDEILARHKLQDDEEQFRFGLLCFCAGMVAATLIFVAAI